MREERVQLPVRLLLQYHDEETYRYLRYVPGNGSLHFGGTDNRNPLSLLQAEREEQLYHIKTCFNDRYWARSKENSVLVSASADEPAADTSLWSCTLLRPSFAGVDRTRIRLFHVQSQSYLSVDKSHRLIIASTNDQACPQQALFTVIDWDSVVNFPRYVAFKGDNGKYLSAFQIGLETYHSFSAADRKDRTVAHEVISSGYGDGSLRIRSMQSHNFWICRPPTEQQGWSCVRADHAQTPENDPHQVFRPTRVGNGADILQINLTSTSSNLHCKRRHRPLYARRNILVAQSLKTSKSCIVVEEAAKSIEIFNVSYYTREAEIVPGNPTSVILGEGSNDRDAIDTVKFGHEFQKEESHTWKSSETTGYVTTVRIKASLPLYSGVGTEFDFSRKFDEQSEWGETTKLTYKSFFSYEPQVEGRTRVQAYAEMVHSKFRIPFKYDQKVTFYDDTVNIEREKHGVYSGQNALLLRWGSRIISPEG